MINTILNSYRDKIDMRLDMLLPETVCNYEAVVKASRYSLFAGGKRIRPILLLEFYKLLGGKDDCAYNFACALEMIHTYSLIHDDLPCMDNDDYRRGKPSCHKENGEDIALLAGDALLTESFGVAARTIGINPEYVSKAIEYLSYNAGINGMIGGQVIDINSEKELTKELLLETYKLKTGALIRCATVCGAILAGADEEKIALSEAYGEKLGLAFQIIDDILDYEGDEEKLGKPVGSDEKNNKKTYVTFFGIDKAKEDAKAFTDDALSILDRLGNETETLKEITNYLLRREF